MQQQEQDYRKIIKQYGNFISKQNNTYTYAIKYQHIYKFVEKWIGNRDADINRVNEMVSNYISGNYIPLHLHLAELNNKLVCYDGNHRREMLNMLIDKRIVNNIIVSIIFNANHDIIYKEFTNINKAIQVPALYFDNQNDITQLKSEILNIVKEYEKKYKPFVSTSTRHLAPNFNRDRFMDELYDFYKNHNCTLAQIHKALQKLNIAYSKQFMCNHSHYNEKVLKKCKKYNFWIFINRRLNFEHVEKYL